MLDPAANAFGMASSNATVQQIVAPWPSPTPITRIFLLSSLGPTGTVDAGSGLITKFY
ncbi:MAG: hypothetical protein ABIP94_23355 [Planctomycetota bacterium]